MLLEQTGMLPQKNKKVEEMSKGMSQIIQFILAVIHDPDLIILDEPFTGLDPANAELLRKMIGSLKDRGKAVIMSTHRMEDVEELCDRLLMINHGKTVLYGALSEIKSKYKSDFIYLEYEGELGPLPDITQRAARKGYAELVLDNKTSPGELLRRLMALGIKISRFEVAAPSLNEIFLKVAGEKNE